MNTPSIENDDLQNRHRQVPGEHTVQLTKSNTCPSEEEYMRAFVQLQQKTQSLEIEIAERKAVQERLRVLAAIVESSDDAIFSKDLDGIVLSWNKAAECMYGYRAEEMLGQSVTRIFPPGYLDEFEQIMARLRQGEKVDHYETLRMRKDGTLLIVSITISPLKDEMGTVVGASTIARDITERRRLEARSQQIFASNLIGIFVAETTGTLLEINQALLNLLEYTQEEVMDADLPTPSVSLFLRSLALQALCQADHAEPQETVLQKKNGTELPVLVAVTTIAHTDTCIGFVLDISERKALERRKDAFIGMASHELKTPLTSLKGFLGLVQRLSVKDGYEKILPYLTRMDTQIDKLTQLINDLLDISRMETGQLIYREAQIEVDGLVRDIVESVQETTQTHHLQCIGETRARVLGDRDRLGQVLINLLTNAIKYSPSADTVVVRLTADEKQALISVQDFGPGIAKAHHHRIFERFYQVNDSAMQGPFGLGIGLTICQEIVKHHRGRIWVESEVGKGATFYLGLPRLQEELQGAR